MGQRYSPKPTEGRYYVTKRPMHIANGDVRQIGDEVPEAFSWPQRRRDAFQSTGQLLYVPHKSPQPPAKVAGPGTPASLESKPAASSQTAPAPHVVASVAPKGDLGAKSKQR